MATSIRDIVDRQIDKVLRQGDRLGTFDQIRQRHFWSTYLFIADPVTNKIAPGPYDIFKAIPGGSGQGYPTNVNLTLRETNWLNGGRVPDNQNFAIMEVGCTIRNPPLEAGITVDDEDDPEAVPAAASNGIFAALTDAQKAYLGKSTMRDLHSFDAYNIATSTVLEMSFLTNNVPLGLVADFSQSGGIIGAPGNEPMISRNRGNCGASNGIPTPAFRRKLDIPILLSSGENMGMRLNVPREIELLAPRYALGTEGPTIVADNGGTGWYEIRVDWWAIESFVEKS